MHFEHIRCNVQLIPILPQIYFFLSLLSGWRFKVRSDLVGVQRYRFIFIHPVLSFGRLSLSVQAELTLKQSLDRASDALTSENKTLASTFAIKNVDDREYATILLPPRVLPPPPRPLLRRVHIPSRCHGNTAISRQMSGCHHQDEARNTESIRPPNSLHIIYHHRDRLRNRCPNRRCYRLRQCIGEIPLATTCTSSRDRVGNCRFYKCQSPCGRAYCCQQRSSRYSPPIRHAMTRFRKH
ncbi:uncharacterized protein V1513DRAFT_283103 [Lipomyces chichibuensis]|uniref:uncharacterized protein n=1 Tax=Lipomyces chichibuensis TaxID=1546026 RepID=UPI003342E864